MFKVPDWESDIPSPKADFAKKAHIKKAAKTKELKKNSSISSQNNNVRSKQKTQNKVTKSSDSDYVKKAPKEWNQSNNVTLLKAKKIEQIKEGLKADQKLPSPEENSKQRNVLSAKTVKKKLKQKDKAQPDTNSTSNGVQNPKKRKNKTNIDKINKSTLPKRIKFSEPETDSVTTLKEIRNKSDKKKEIIKNLLENNHRRSINDASNSDKLRMRMLERLKAAQFRYLNEKLYTSSGDEAKQIFQTDPEAFSTYHQGYQQQVKKWPVNPLDIIVKKILNMPKTFQIADMGCGEAALSRRVPHSVRSFDLVASSPGVVACDIAHTPLQAASMDVAVYCLSLMGTELTQYLVEANRVLKNGGQLLIAEVESRFDDVNTFARDVERLGFKLKSLNKQHSVFLFLHFVKNQEPPVKKAKLPDIQLKPCLYKKR